MEKTDFPHDSPQYLLWEQQQKQASYSDSKSMKWHPVMIRWCISIYLKSPSAYEQLRNSGFLKLPNKKTYQNMQIIQNLNVELILMLSNTW